MTRQQQLDAMRAEAHRLLDALIDTTGRYYGNEDAADKARQLDALTNTRSAINAIVDAHGTATGYADTYSPVDALTEERHAHMRMGMIDTVRMLEDCDVRVRYGSESVDFAS